MLSRILTAGLICLFLGSSAFTSAPGPVRIPSSSHQMDVIYPNIQYHINNRSNIWMTIYNYGTLGDPAILELPSNRRLLTTAPPSCEFPGGSSIEYLYYGAVWIGALIKQDEYFFPRVSVGSEGWTREINELWPGEGSEGAIIERSNIPGAVNTNGESIYSPEALAPQEFIATFTDTLRDVFFVHNDPVDGPHVPLGIKVRQKSMVWDAFGFNDFIIYDYTIWNVGADTLKNPYFGWFINAEVGREDEGLEYYGTDDLRGFLGEYNGTTINITYANDNDGRPYNIGAGAPFTCPGVAGQFLPQSADNPAHLSFNWWISSADPLIDFGPCWQSHADSIGMSWMAILGTPEGDLRKYQLMTSREIDYDQVRTDMPNWIAAHPQQFFDEQGHLIEEQPWYPPNANEPTNIANGFHARYLVSWGPLGENEAPPGQEPETYLYPGDSLKLTLVYVCGDSLHNSTHSQGDPEHINPALYDYSDLVYNCSKAQFLCDHGFQIIPPYAPYDFHIFESSDEWIWLHWDSYSTLPNTGVNIYRRTEGSEYGTTPLNSTPISSTSFRDTNIQIGQRYYYKAQAIRFDSLKSYYSNEITIVAGAPLPPTGLEAENSHNGSIPLSWNPNSEPDINHYIIYRLDTLGSFQSIGTSSTTAFTDNNVTNGLEYTYKISAVDNGGLESDLSDSASAIPMGFDEELLVIIHHATVSLFEWNNDSLDNYYTSLFDDISETPDFRYQNSSEPFPTLSDLSPYRSIWIIDDIHQNISSSMELHQFRDEILPTYIDLGGNIVISGRRLITNWFALNMGHSVVQLSLLLQDFGVTQTFGVQWIPVDTIGFIAAQPTILTYPWLDLDSAKVEQLQSPVLYTMEVDGMVPASWGETFYTYVSNYPDSSELHGMAIGVRCDSTTAIITFPLYAMEPYDSVLTLAENILEYVRGEHFQGIPVPISRDEPPIPKEYALYQNYPNPFNNTTILSFALPTASRTTIIVYNILGQRVTVVLDAHLEAGIHRIQFDASDLASGVYFYEFKAGNFLVVKKMVLLK